MYKDDMKKSVDLYTFNNIYKHLADDVSKEIFQIRLMYSISKDNKYIADLIKTIDKSVIRKLSQINENEELVLFGAGFYGSVILENFNSNNWKYVIDNNPIQKNLKGFAVIAAKEFLKAYSGEYVVISSYLYYSNMKEQLEKYAVPEEKIINVGEAISKLIQEQYFDLEYLSPSKEKEVFIDVGCYNGMTSKYFSEWCSDKNNAIVYAFEADKDNVSKCRDALGQLDIEYKLIKKGLWSHNTTLCFNAEGTVGSRVDEAGKDKVEVVSLDEYLQDEIATFIKMDIEGAELEALKGAEQQIRKHKPKLAISVYHKANDIWEIPSLILKYNPEYKLYLRHYTFLDTDTILYAI